MDQLSIQGAPGSWEEGASVIESGFKMLFTLNSGLLCICEKAANGPLQL